MNAIEIIATEQDSLLKQLLEQNGLHFFEKKGVDIPSILIAIGAGSGIAAVLRGLAAAISSYFEGAAKVSRARNQKVTLILQDGTHLVLDGENVAGLADRLTTLLVERPHKS